MSPDYVIDSVVATVQYVLERSWGSSGPYHLKQAPFVAFVHHILRLSGCPVPTILVALTYLDRAKHQMRITEGKWACERAFLGALILANKVRPITRLLLAPLTTARILSTPMTKITTTVHGPVPPALSIPAR